MPEADSKSIQNFGCGGVEPCCFYAASGGLYCQSCASEKSTKEKVVELAKPIAQTITSACHDASPGVCCEEPKGTCGLAKCADYKTIMPEADSKSIQNFGCGGVEPCCFYAASG